MFFAFLTLNLICLSYFVIIPCVGQDQFTIIRSSAGSLLDLFIVPRSKCKIPSSSFTCSAFYSGSVNHDPTQCKCACRYGYSTFGFYNGRWICLNNQKVREQPGCQLSEGEVNFHPLKIFSTGSSFKMIFPSISCTIDHSASLYRKCDGTWAAINVKSNIFSFWPLTETLGPGRYRYTVKVGTVTPLAGKMVSLKVNCKKPSKSSCVLFKVAGQFNCPVDIMRFSSTQTPTTSPISQPAFPSNASTTNSSTEAPGSKKEASNSSENGGSSGTVAAIVIIIILIIIVAAIIGFVIWKRRRGENILVMDHLLSIVSKFRSPPPTKKQEESEERIYAEIPEQPAPRQTSYSAPAYDAGIYSIPFNQPNSANAPPNKQNNNTSPEVQDEAPIDERGYMVPVDSPLNNSAQYNGQRNTGSKGKNKNPKTYNKSREQQRFTHEGGVGSNGVAPFYDVLEASGKRNAENNDKQTSVHNRQASSPDRGRTGPAGPGTDGASGSNKYVAKQRRRPPSPPRKI